MMNRNMRVKPTDGFSSMSRRPTQKIMVILAMTGLMLGAEPVAAAVTKDLNYFLPDVDEPATRNNLSLSPSNAHPMLSQSMKGTAAPTDQNLALVLDRENQAVPVPAPVPVEVPESGITPPVSVPFTVPPMKGDTEGDGPLQKNEDMQPAKVTETEPLLETSVPPTAPVNALSKGHIEAGIQRYVLTGQQPSWEGEYVRGAWVQDEKNVWNYEVVNARRYGDSGTFYSGGLTHTFDDDWYAALSAGSSSGGFFWPRERIDVFVHYKFLERRNLVAMIGYTHYQAKDAHHDQILHMGADYYFESPWIVSGEFIVNDSSPGHVKANYVFLTATYGHERESYVTLRIGHGKEAYQLLGGAQVISGFYSSIATLSYRKWIGKDWGFNFVGEYYTNSLYKRRGVEIGIFKDF